MSDLTSLKAQALAEIANIKNEAVKEYLTLKTGHYSLTVVAVTAVVGVVVGLLLHVL